jgi:peroxiredoxin Q/BCP
MAKGVQVNDKFPAFQLKDHEGMDTDFSQFLGNPLVVYFYILDNTPGCTKEACSFRDNYEFFTDAGATVIGISSDSPETHRKFREKHNLPFPLLSDKGNKFRKKVGVPGGLLGLIPGRVTYIIDSQGYVKQMFNSQLDVAGHINEAIATIESLKESANS